MGMVQWSGVVCDSQGVTDSPIVHLSEVFDWFFFFAISCYSCSLKVWFPTSRILALQIMISYTNNLGGCAFTRVATWSSHVFASSIRFSKVNMNHCRFQRSIRYQELILWDGFGWSGMKWSWNLWGTAVSNVQRDQQSSISCSTDPVSRNGCEEFQTFETPHLIYLFVWHQTRRCWAVVHTVNHLTICDNQKTSESATLIVLECVGLRQCHNVGVFRKCGRNCRWGDLWWSVVPNCCLWPWPQLWAAERMLRHDGKLHWADRRHLAYLPSTLIVVERHWMLDLIF